MNSLLRFLEKYHFLILFLVLEGFSIWLLASNNYYQKASFGKISRELISIVDNHLSNMNQYLRLKQANIELVVENISLRNEIAQLKNKLERNQANRTDSTSSGVRYTYSTARVINNSVNRQNNYITLNAGSIEGVAREMGVITKNGVVGVTASVSSNFSTVISLLNTDLKISAKHRRSGTFGSLYWNGIDYRTVILSEIPQHVNLIKGDTIVTSGYSSIFPPDIPIGTVDEFEMKGGSFYEVKVKLLTDFKQLDNVYIIKSHDAFERNLIENQK